jgi:pSer/pThr/pTyr-binding forkhead associated (FHA) protein
MKTGDDWSVMDLGSANGTMLNAAPVTAEARSLKDGDVLNIGETTLLFRLPT